jgi:hypothetical protein
MHTTEYRGLSDNPDTGRTALPRQNRVTPTGDIIAHPARGTLFGNRGCLHDDAGRIMRHHQGRRWIACALSFKGRRRALLQPGRYTELFFLDEPTALAAGHRPCAECRRADYDRFRNAWSAAFGDRPGAEAMDRVLHAARLSPAGHGAAPASALPEGCMLRIDGAPHLIAGGAVWPWSPGGYGPPRSLPPDPWPILTPRPLVAVLASGYRADCHGTVTAR